MNTRRRLWILLLAGAVCAALILSWGLLRSPQSAYDDAFITYRYADNLRDGLGLVYNPGEWVLGTTAPFYAIALGVVSHLGMPVEWWGHWISVGAWLVGAWAALAQLWQRQRYAAGVLAAVMIALHPLTATALGMETSLLLALLLLSSWAWMSDHTIAASILSGLAILTRQDAALFVGLLGLAYAFEHRRLPWREAALTLALVLPWFGFAFWRYGSPLPNSVLAKVNQNQFMAVGGGKSFVAAGVDLLAVGPPIVAAAVAFSLVLGLVVIVRHAREWWWLPAWVLLYVGIYTALNVVAFPWYFVPAVTGALLICAIGLGHLLGDGQEAPARPRVARQAAAVLALICAFIIGAAYFQRTLEQSTRDHPGYRAEYRDVGEWLAANTSETDRVASIEIGVIGHRSRRPIVDTMGLISPGMRGHLVGWVETLAYAMAQYEPELVVALTGTAWDAITPQWWFRDRYAPAASFGEVTIYRREPPEPAPPYVVNEPADFAAGFTLAGLSAPERALTPGTTLQLDLEVEVTRRLAGDCQIIGYLLDTATGSRTGESKDEPFGGTYSCPAWQPGDELRIPLRIVVPPELAPGAYRVGVEMYDITGDSHYTLASDPNAQQVRLGWFRVGSPERAPAIGPRRDVSLSWDHGIALTGVALSEDPVEPGGAVPIQFEWRAERPLDRDLTFFIHLLDPTGEIVAQSDRRPFDGRFPTPVWLPGEPLLDTYTLSLPPDIPAGDYRLRVGFYDERGRLPLRDQPEDSYILNDVITIR